MDDTKLVTVDELQARLPFDMDDLEEREALGALEYLSDEARTYGRASWLDREHTPQAVRSLILKAAQRHMKNYEGFVQSRAGDETLVWSDQRGNAGSAYFTDAEIKALGKLAGGQGIYTAPIYAWGINTPERRDCYGNPTETVYVPTESGSHFPFFAGEPRVGM